MPHLNNYHMKNLSRLMSKSALVALLALGLLACTSDDEVIFGNITIAESELNKTVEWDEVESSITFTANDKWTASVSDVTTRAANTKIEWLTLTVNSGNAGEVKMPFCLKRMTQSSIATHKLRFAVAIKPQSSTFTRTRTQMLCTLWTSRRLRTSINISVQANGMRVLRRVWIICCATMPSGVSGA